MLKVVEIVSFGIIRAEVIPSGFLSGFGSSLIIEEEVILLIERVIFSVLIWCFLVEIIEVYVFICSA